MDLACQIALDATRTVYLEENGRKEIDIKRYAKVEKVGVRWYLEELCTFHISAGVMLVGTAWALVSVLLVLLSCLL